MRTVVSDVGECRGDWFVGHHIRMMIGCEIELGLEAPEDAEFTWAELKRWELRANLVRRAHLSQCPECRRCHALWQAASEHTSDPRDDGWCEMSTHGVPEGGRLYRVWRESPGFPSFTEWGGVGHAPVRWMAKFREYGELHRAWVLSTGTVGLERGVSIVAQPLGVRRWELA